MAFGGSFGGFGMSAPVPTSFLQSDQLLVVQRYELAELVGIESRNKYSIHTPDGRQVAFAAEQGKSFFAMLFRAIAGHWRTFDIMVFGPDRAPIFRAHHPFRFYFQQLQLSDGSGAPIGEIERTFSIFSKSFDVKGPSGELLMQVSSPFWRLWTFSFERQGQQVALVEKKWFGALTELFTDADRFRVSFSPQLPLRERALVLVAALFIDLMYFENNHQTPSHLLGE